MIIFFKTNFNLVRKYKDVLNKTYQPQCNLEVGFAAHRM